MTELTEFQRKLSALLPDVELRFEEALAKHTSFRIGGDAEVMAFPKTKIELADILKACAKLNCKCAILGAGTNVLAPDEGCPGAGGLPEGLPWRHGTAGRDPHPGDGGRDHGTGGGERCKHRSDRYGIRPRHTGNRRRRRVYERRGLRRRDLPDLRKC